MQYIFIHGLGQNASSWECTISYMEKPIQTLCPDLSILLNNKEVTYANLYKAFCDYCDSISEPLNLCGLSLGGVLSLNYAADHPEKVRSLVLIAAPYKMPKVLLKLQNLIFRIMPESSFLKIGFQKKDFISLTNSMTELDFSNRLKDISCSALILCGEKDNANKKASMHLAGNIPEAEFRSIADTNHEVNIESPQELASLLMHFYREQRQK